MINPRQGMVIEATPDQCKTDEMYQNLGVGITRHLNHARSNVAALPIPFADTAADPPCSAIGTRAPPFGEVVIHVTRQRVGQASASEPLPPE
jgi:hypothetical protein